MRPFKALAILGFAVLLAAAAVAVVPGTLPNLVAGVRERPESPALVTGCWVAATTASIVGKRILAGDALTWKGAATAHIVGTVSNRIVPAGVGAGGTYLVALRRGGMTLTAAAAMAALWAIASGIAHSSGALVGLVWLYFGVIGLAALAVVAAVVGWSVHARRSPSRDGTGPSTTDEMRAEADDPPEVPAVADEPASAADELHWSSTRADTESAPDTRRGRVVQKLGSLRRSVIDAVAVVRAHPRRAGAAILAQAVAMSCLAVGFAIAASSFDVPVATMTVLAAYMGGTALSATIPTPAGIGSADAALVGALVMVGSPLSVAVPAVLIFRAVILLAPIAVAAIMALGWTSRLWPRRDEALAVSQA